MINRTKLAFWGVASDVGLVSLYSLEFSPGTELTNQAHKKHDYY